LGIAVKRVVAFVLVLLVGCTTGSVRSNNSTAACQRLKKLKRKIDSSVEAGVYFFLDSVASVESGSTLTVSADFLNRDSWVARSAQGGGENGEAFVVSWSYRTSADLFWASTATVDEWPKTWRLYPSVQTKARFDFSPLGALIGGCADLSLDDKNEFGFVSSKPIKDFDLLSIVYRFGTSDSRKNLVLSSLVEAPARK
jgi:hypothetical protein